MSSSRSLNYLTLSDVYVTEVDGIIKESFSVPFIIWLSCLQPKQSKCFRWGWPPDMALSYLYNFHMPPHQREAPQCTLFPLFFFSLIPRKRGSVRGRVKCRKRKRREIIEKVLCPSHRTFPIQLGFIFMTVLWQLFLALYWRRERSVC